MLEKIREIWINLKRRASTWRFRRYFSWEKIGNATKWTFGLGYGISEANVIYTHISKGNAYNAIANPLGWLVVSISSLLRIISLGKQTKKLRSELSRVNPECELPSKPFRGYKFVVSAQTVSSLCFITYGALMYCENQECTPPGFLKSLTPEGEHLDFVIGSVGLTLQLFSLIATYLTLIPYYDKVASLANQQLDGVHLPDESEGKEDRTPLLGESSGEDEREDSLEQDQTGGASVVEKECTALVGARIESLERQLRNMRSECDELTVYNERLEASIESLRAELSAKGSARTSITQRVAATQTLFFNPVNVATQTEGFSELPSPTPSPTH